MIKKTICSAKAVFYKDLIQQFYIFSCFFLNDDNNISTCIIKHRNLYNLYFKSRKEKFTLIPSLYSLCAAKGESSL